MKWGRRKPPPSASPSSSRPSFVSHVFPMSWLSKFKHMSISPKPKPGKVKQKGKESSVSMSPPQCASGNGGRFYGGNDDDAFWRLSFGEETMSAKMNTGALKSVWYASNDELGVPSSSCRGCRSNATKVGEREEEEKLREMVLGLRKKREMLKDVEISPEMEARYGEKRTESKTPRRRIERRWKLRQTNRQWVEEKALELETGSHEAELKATKSVEKEALKRIPSRTSRTTKGDRCKLVASGSRKHSSASSQNHNYNSGLNTTAEEDIFATQNVEETEPEVFSAENLGSEWQKLKELKIEELKLKSEKQRKSLHISRDTQRRTKQHSKVRVYSPRTPSKVEICKIKALEDIRKSKLKMKRKAKEKTAEGITGLESFAMVKCSFDPQQDFRDSMVEMIMEKRISRPEELEELLACYLTLNSDEYHDLIIKVFRQVWFDMNQACFRSDFQVEDRCYN